MNLHEYQAKDLLARYRIPVPRGQVAYSAEEACAVAQALGGGEWIVKAQIHAGGRGKAGGVKRVKSLAELATLTQQWLSQPLITAQTPATGLPIKAVLIDTPCNIARELYLGLMLDRREERIVILATAQGGMDIEELTLHRPDALQRRMVDPIVGVQPYQARELGFALALTNAQITAFTTLLQNLYAAFIDQDLSLLEINPLVITAEEELLVIDAKLSVDDNALYRQPDLAALRDESQENARETLARRADLNYIALQGNIGCMVNGAGLAMATMDLIQLHGGQPANFLDVGGGTNAEKVAQAFRLILADEQVSAVLVNIFGGIVRCDLIAEGILTALRDMHTSIPIVVRLEGTHAAQGQALLAASELPILIATDLDDAARRAVMAATAQH